MMPRVSGGFGGVQIFATHEFKNCHFIPSTIRINELIVECQHVGVPEDRDYVLQHHYLLLI